MHCIYTKLKMYILYIKRAKTKFGMQERERSTGIQKKNGG